LAPPVLAAPAAGRIDGGGLLDGERDLTEPQDILFVTT
jgi:hypothetical protein